MKNKIIKIIAGMTAFLIITLLIFVLNAFMGNPISSFLAAAKIRTYVEKNYSDIDFKISKVKYDLKNASYYSTVQSMISQDTYFNVSWKRGRIIDDYEYVITNKITTYLRVYEEINTTIKDIINSEFPYETSILYVDLGKREEDLMKLSLDMPLDIHNPPIPIGITIYIVSVDISYEYMSARLLQLSELMEQHQIPIEEYDIVIEKPKTDEKEQYSSDSKNYLRGFPAEKLKEDDLIEVIKAHQKSYEETANKEKRNEINQSKDESNRENIEAMEKEFEKERSRTSLN